MRTASAGWLTNGSQCHRSGLVWGVTCAGPMSVFQFLYLVSLSSQALKSKWHPADQSPDIWQIWWAVRWAGPEPAPASPRPDSRASPARRERRETVERERDCSLYAGPARLHCNQRWRWWDLSISVGRLPSQWQPASSSFILPSSSLRRNGQCHSGQDNQGLAVYSHNRRFFLGKISN